MGAAKASLPFGGSTFLERIVAAARGAFEEVIAVQRRGEPPVGIVPTIFEKAHEDEAAIFGLERALSDAGGRRFVLAVDYPLVTPAVLGDLRRRFEASPAPALIPVRHGEPQTLCAGYAPALRGIIEAAIREGRYSLRGLALPAELVQCDLVELSNVNTPAELGEAESTYEQQRLLSSR